MEGTSIPWWAQEIKDSVRSHSTDIRNLDREKASREELKDVIEKLDRIGTNLNRILFAIVAACIGLVVAIVQAGILGQ